MGCRRFDDPDNLWFSNRVRAVERKCGKKWCRPRHVDFDSFLKASILFMYLRIFPGERFRTVLWGTQAFNLAICVTFVLLGIFQCRPIHLAWTAWRGDSESQGTCMDVVIIAMVYSAIQVGLDIWMLILPLTQTLGLNMKWSKKFGLMFMFSLGLF
ncbi:hypothetical protein CGCS363_v010487 [Colletotrichum siamense]|uniref:uncharacterized protein n=1 Tax=Colletotrichum siamense TaxID=690259 RepID=UPI00187286A7|nr:uncharacterized protein CGCS363_v010487 [Colletotrichum siamense]KAF5492472.1 hypothetical protein CGCS363_v010487 [Colletotrichum siamense]